MLVECLDAECEDTRQDTTGQWIWGPHIPGMVHNLLGTYLDVHRACGSASGFIGLLSEIDLVPEKL